jgi:magnesium-transporting ATPase (P-type)
MSEAKASSADGREAARRAEPWHAVPGDQALELLASSSDGLDEEEAARRLERHGPNALPAGGGNDALRILLRQIKDPLIYVLLASTVLAVLTGKVLDGLVIGGVVVLNAIIGFVQEYRASQAIKALSAMAPIEAIVTRGGQKRKLPARDLVPGDVVRLESGDKVPADMRLLEARGLRVEEAALTGESVPVEKSTDPVDEDALIGDRRSVLYSGTLVTQGRTTAAVVATGAATELGRISAMLGEASALETPLTRQLGVIARWIAFAIVIISVILLGVGLLRGYTIGDAVLAAVTLAVAAIPEGLPAIVTISLAIGVRRMARRRAIVRKLPAVETLGSTTVICTDKTGTLTGNEMTVQALWSPEGSWRLSGTGYAPDGELRQEDDSPARAVPPSVAELVRAGVLCNDATLQKKDDHWQMTGDPTEGALVVAGQKVGQPADDLRVRHRRIDTIPFESERQFMATLHEAEDGGRVIYLKGAPEVVLERCRSDGERQVDPERVRQEIDRIAGEGMRVLALAARRPDTDLDHLDEQDVESGFVFLGLEGMIDPPRAEAIEAVRACREAGIVIKMITGDHGMTARAIGEKLGLAGPDDAAVTGRELDGAEPDEIRGRATAHNVFARVAPEHKLQLVKALQAEGHVVAMTGDGVNDAPALKQADIGVAMGITGTEVAKEAADMVLTDDNFASIGAAVEEGRRVYDNLIKALAFVLPTNLGLALILMIAVAAFPIVGGEPVLPMQPVQILWINLVAAVALALPLSFEAMEPDLMRRPPRPPDAPVMSPFVVQRTIGVAILMAGGAVAVFLAEQPGEGSRGLAYATAQTQAVTTVIFFQIFYLLNCRSFQESILRMGVASNPWIFVGIGVVLVLQVGFVYLPVMHTVFGSAPLDLRGWIEAALVGLLIIPVIGVEKWWRRARDGEAAARRGGGSDRPAEAGADGRSAPS